MRSFRWSRPCRLVVVGQHRLCTRKANDDVVVPSTNTAPMPPDYVPVEHRDAGDESLLFLRKPNAAKPRRPVLPEGCIEAPFLPDRPEKPKRYIDAHAERLKTTSVGGGRPLLSQHSKSFFLGQEEHAADAEPLQRTFHSPLSDADRMEPKRDSGSEDDKPGGTAASDGNVGGNGAQQDSTPPNPAESIPRSPLDELREDIQKLEYYEGTPDYAKHLEAFRKKHNSDVRKGKQAYSDREIAAGLEGEPLDLHRVSSKAQSRLTAGPHGFHPMTILQQHGMARNDGGYAFSPSTVLGNIDGGLDGNKPDFSLASDELKDQVASNAHEDKSLAFQYLGINTIQRRQIRMCLSDLDTKDYNATMHVMLSYPYTDWLYCFYLIAVGFLVYDLQRRYRMYDFYDEYLGLDLRQVRRLEKPLLFVVTCAIVCTLLFQPILLASIATTRIYRIVLGRPIGPP